MLGASTSVVILFVYFPSNIQVTHQIHAKTYVGLHCKIPSKLNDLVAAEYVGNGLIQGFRCLKMCTCPTFAIHRSAYMEQRRKYCSNAHLLLVVLLVPAVGQWEMVISAIVTWRNFDILQIKACSCVYESNQ